MKNPALATDKGAPRPAKPPLALLPGGDSAPLPAKKVTELRAERLKKRYRARVVVKDVSLEVRSDEVIGLLGPNGAGKTTCFYMMVGLVPMDGGELYLDGTRLTHMQMHRRARLGLSYLPQEPSIFRRLTVAQNVQAVLELYHRSAETIRDRLDALLRDLHISHLRNSPAMSLSGGERRRTEIARALATEPAFVLMDEPAAGLPEAEVPEFAEVVRSVRDEHEAGVLLIDHNVALVLDVCDRVHVLDQGRTLFEGTPAEVRSNLDLAAAYLGDSAVSEHG